MYIYIFIIILYVERPLTRSISAHNMNVGNDTIIYLTHHVMGLGMVSVVKHTERRYNRVYMVLYTQTKFSHRVTILTPTVSDF